MHKILGLCGLDTPSASASGYSTTFGFEKVKWLVCSKPHLHIFYT